VKLLLFYVLFVAIGDVIAYGAGLLVERSFQAASLPVFLTLFATVFWLAWRLAIRATA